ncbi:efflux RND transporter permease subunit [Frondihabitans australicus]|uniref:HAE1 family hydrophobic/amphiphilic exporter-1 n=1 Tax=Frondihabitans australicus TaxID=386892 RepID=A0A495IM64_9MICO|nr:efflux RND transporter permease subunit [Frondihabitans australicus]RKR76215.1 HAE1 family hydrophobic/amphiphilic exporter-1 [Frondihabitans australicus]
MHFLSIFSLRNRALIALITIVVAIFGGYALTSLKQELIPDITLPQVAIVTSYPGASPQVVSDSVSSPIEKAIQVIPGLQTTTATSQTSTSTIQASFDYGTDIPQAEEKIQQAIDATTLPDSVQTQVVAGDLSDLPVVEIAVTGGPSDKQKLVDDLNNITVPALQKLDGVNQATVYGDAGQRVTIQPDASKLAAVGLSTSAIKDALDDNGTLVPGGQITQNGKTLSIQSGSRLTSVTQVENLPLVGAKSPVTGAAVATAIKDVATVKLTSAPVTSISRVNGKDALTIAVTKTQDSNTVDVSKTIRNDIPSLLSNLNDGVKMTVVFDQAPFIQQSITSLATEGGLGLLFAVIVIFLFLFSFRSTIVTAISIPTSVLITFIGLLATGYTINILTLGALTIAVGRVVDDSIVVTENIKRHLVPGVPRVQAITAAVREVASAVTASTLTTVVVFLPLAFVQSEVGELFRPFALTVVIALLGSLFVSLTIVPVLSYWFMRAGKEHRHVEASPVSGGEVARGGERLRRGYLPILSWTLKFKKLTLLFAVLVLAGSGAAATLLTTNFLGSSGQNTLSISQKLPAGTSLTAQSDAAKKVETALESVKQVQTVQLTIGSSGNSFAAFLGGGDDSTVTYQITTDENADQDALTATIRSKMDALRGAGDITVEPSSGFGSSNDIEVDVTANDASTLTTAANRVEKAMQGIPSAAGVTSNLSKAQPLIGISVDRVAAASYGLSEIEVGGLVSQEVQPTDVGSLEISGATVDIYTTPTSPPTTLSALKDLTIPTARGVIPLSKVATVTQTNGPASITTENAVRSATITITPASNDLSAANSQVSKALAGVSLPRGASAAIGGVTSQQTTAFQDLGIALIVAILVVYIVMVATFKSLLQPLLLLVSIPFAATGAILLQVGANIPLGVPSLIGVLMLVGIVVTNAIVLIDLVNQYRRNGLSVHDALVEGASRRLRPILMTALATIFALTPLALGLTGHSSFISQPLAIVVIGGLLSSTVLTLIVLPALYAWVFGALERRAARRASADGALSAQALPSRQ